LSEREQWLPWIPRLSPYALASAAAPPISLTCPRRGLEPASDEIGREAHLPRFGVHLHARLRALGTESYLHQADAADPACGGGIEAFFLDVLARGR
jgi:hypothetical protein